MERIGTLIEKLQQMWLQNVPQNQLLMVAELLVKELQVVHNTSVETNEGVAVITPIIKLNNIDNQNVEKFELNKNNSLNFTTEYTEPGIIDPPKSTEWKVLTNISDANIKAEPTALESIAGLLSEIDEQPPTLLLNEHIPAQIIGEKPLPPTPLNETTSINDKLKEPKIEVATVLNQMPISDLKRAIGINDKFVFIKELFKESETLYEKAIAALNSCNSWLDAEKYIYSELKHKLQWDDDTESVKQFYQLVKRRFS